MAATASEGRSVSPQLNVGPPACARHPPFVPIYQGRSTFANARVSRRIRVRASGMDVGGVREPVVSAPACPGSSSTLRTQHRRRRPAEGPKSLNPRPHTGRRALSAFCRAALVCLRDRVLWPCRWRRSGPRRSTACFPTCSPPCRPFPCVGGIRWTCRRGRCWRPLGARICWWSAPAGTGRGGSWGPRRGRCWLTAVPRGGGSGAVGGGARRGAGGRVGVRSAHLVQLPCGLQCGPIRCHSASQAR